LEINGYSVTISCGLSDIVTEKFLRSTYCLVSLLNIRDAIFECIGICNNVVANLVVTTSASQHKGEQVCNGCIGFFLVFRNPFSSYIVKYSASSEYFSYKTNLLAKRFFFSQASQTYHKVHQHPLHLKIAQSSSSLAFLVLRASPI
jgi:hypothetical protein